MSDTGHRRVFISYAHESPAHIERVRQLWTLLRANGVDARLDLPATAQRQDWPLWMIEQFRYADYILVVASAAYRRRTDGEAGPDEGRGVQFEGGLLRDRYYADRTAWTKRILPVLLPGETRDGIPTFLGPFSGTIYPIKELSATGIEDLIRVITNQPAFVDPPLGPVPVLPPEAVPRPAAPGPLNELTALVDALIELPEFASASGRNQILLLLPPTIRGAINDVPNPRLHLISIIQTCARFGTAGRQALLDILGAVLPAEDRAVQRTSDLIKSATLFS